MHEGQVRVTVTPKRCRHANKYAVALIEPSKIEGASEKAGIDCSLNAFGAYVLDVGLAPIQRINLVRVDIEANYVEAGIRKYQGEGKADVALSNHAHYSRVLLDLLQKGGDG
jgi:hypothetical protein